MKSMYWFNGLTQARKMSIGYNANVARVPHLSASQ